MSWWPENTYDSFFDDDWKDKPTEKPEVDFTWLWKGIGKVKKKNEVEVDFSLSPKQEDILDDEFSASWLEDAQDMDGHIDIYQRINNMLLDNARWNTEKDVLLSILQAELDILEKKIAHIPWIDHSDWIDEDEFNFDTLGTYYKEQKRMLESLKQRYQNREDVIKIIEVDINTVKPQEILYESPLSMVNCFERIKKEVEHLRLDDPAFSRLYYIVDSFQSTNANRLTNTLDYENTYRKIYDEAYEWDLWKTLLAVRGGLTNAAAWFVEIDNKDPVHRQSLDVLDDSVLGAENIRKQILDMMDKKISTHIVDQEALNWYETLEDLKSKKVENLHLNLLIELSAKLWINKIVSTAHKDEWDLRRKYASLKKIFDTEFFKRKNAYKSWLFSQWKEIY